MSIRCDIFIPGLRFSKEILLFEVTRQVLMGSLKNLLTCNCVEGRMMDRNLSQQGLLRDAMVTLGMTREQLAARLNVGEKALNRWMAPTGSKEFRTMPPIAMSYIQDIISWRKTNYCNAPSGGVSLGALRSVNGEKMTLRERLLDAMLDGLIGNGLVVTRQEVMNFFSDVKSSYTGVLLSNAEMETGIHSPTWAKYTNRIEPGTYRIHPDALAQRARERQVQSKAVKKFTFQPLERDPRRTFEIEISSDIAGYAVRIFECIYGGEVVPLQLIHPIRYQISPSAFYRNRQHYLGHLIGEVKGELRHGILLKLDKNDPNFDATTLDNYICVNLHGWPNGYPDATEDDLAGFENP